MKNKNPSTHKPIMDHRDLDVWNLAVGLASDIYRLTKKLPPEEKYVLCSQLRSASVSIASNIAEGAGRGSRKEFIRFLYIASGSVSELEPQLIILEKTGLVPEVSELTDIQEKMYKVKRMVHGLIRALKN